MSTPLERLQAILANVVPSHVVHTAEVSAAGDRLVLVPQKLQEFELRPSSDKLQPLLEQWLQERWDGTKCQFSVSETPLSLFERIKHKVIVEYARASKMGEATKRKTEMFIQSVELGEVVLASYLMQLFVESSATEYAALTMAEKQAKFETLESLRRVYGKQR